MTKTLRLFIALLMLLAWSVARPGDPLARAQLTAESNWTAWLYGSQFGELRLVQPNGDTLDRLTLPLAQGFDRYGEAIAVSPSGAFVVYTARDTTTGQDSQQMFVYERPLGSLAASYALHPATVSTTLDLNAAPVIFSESRFEVVFGHLVWPDDVDPSEASWELVVLNYRSGMVSASLTSDDYGDESFVVPVVWDYHNGIVRFTLVPYATEMPLLVDLLAWDVGSGSVREAGVVSLLGDRLAATGEVIFPGLDERLPVPQGMGPFSLNTVQVIQPDPDPNALPARFPFYAVEDMPLWDAYFVQNGEHVLVALDDGSWRLVARSGDVVRSLDLPDAVRRVFATPDGFVYLDEGLTHVTTRGDAFESTTNWASDPGNPLQLAHVSSVAAMPGQWTPWAQLAEPLTAAP